MSDASIVNFKETFSARLKSLRIALGWSKKELSEHSGVSCMSVHYMESGRNLPSIISALKLSKCFNLTVEDLFGEINED